MQWHWNWKSGPTKKFTAHFCFQAHKYASPSIFTARWWQMHSNGTMILQHFKECIGEFQNGQMNIHNNDHSGQPRTHHGQMCMSQEMRNWFYAAKSMLGMAQFQNTWKHQRLFKNSCKCKRLIFTVMLYSNPCQDGRNVKKCVQELLRNTDTSVE